MRERFSANAVLLSRFLFFLFGSREQNIVQNEPVAGRIFVQRQIRCGVAHSMAIIFGVMSAIPRERSAPKIAVNVFHFVGAFFFAQQNDGFFDKFFVKSGRLPQKALNNVGVALGEHGWHGSAK